jgi:hypothetical protein
MKALKTVAITALASLGLISTAYAENFNIKYSTNYLMPAYVNFSNGGGSYRIQSKINVPLYNIVFKASGSEYGNQFHMTRYTDSRNGKVYAKADISGNTIKYGKVKDEQKQESVKMPTFDLFSVAFQLSYYDKLPTSFQTTNGKKLYPTHNVALRKSVKNVSVKGQTYQEITYKFKTNDGKYITVKKYDGEKFPRYISYNRDGDNYELKFDSFVK